MSQKLYTTANFYFGEKHLDTLPKLDKISRMLRRSRTSTLDFLITYFEKNEERKSTPTFY